MERKETFSEFSYKRIDLEEVKKKIREITEEVKQASSAEEQAAAIYRMNEVEKEISTADSLVYIRYTVNTKDEFYVKEREYNDQISPILEEEMQKYKEALLHSPFRKELEEKFGKVIFLNLDLAMKGFSPEITGLLQEESRLSFREDSIIFPRWACLCRARTVRSGRKRTKPTGSFLMIIRKNWMKFSINW